MHCVSTFNKIAIYFSFCYVLNSFTCLISKVSFVFVWMSCFLFLIIFVLFLRMCGSVLHFYKRICIFLKLILVIFTKYDANIYFIMQQNVKHSFCMWDIFFSVQHEACYVKIICKYKITYLRILEIVNIQGVHYNLFYHG